eukprot:gene49154-60169_t
MTEGVCPLSSDPCKQQGLCRGIVEVVSDPLHLAMGRVVFVTLLRETDTDPRPSHFVIAIDAIVANKAIKENSVMEVHRAKAFTWKNSEGQTGGPGTWYLISSAADYDVLPTPAGHLKNSFTSQYEVSLEGIVRGFHSGVVLLSAIVTKENHPWPANASSSSSRQSLMKVLVHHLHSQCLSAEWQAVRVGSHVHLSRLLPVHLHGRLQACAYTVRSRLAVVAQPPDYKAQERPAVCSALCGGALQEL